MTSPKRNSPYKENKMKTAEEMRILASKVGVKNSNEDIRAKADKCLSIIHKKIEHEATKGECSVRISAHDIDKNFAHLSVAVDVINTLRNQGYKVDTELEEHRHQTLNFVIGYMNVLIISW